MEMVNRGKYSLRGLCFVDNQSHSRRRLCILPKRIGWEGGYCHQCEHKTARMEQRNNAHTPEAETGRVCSSATVGWGHPGIIVCAE